MKLFEYQAKQLFGEAGIPVPDSLLVEKDGDWKVAVASFATPCVVKAQMLSGKRGKAGLVRFAKTTEETLAAAQHIFDAPQGIRRILVEQAVDFAEEIYLAVTMDPESARAMVMACREGGMDIEELAATAPEKILKVYVDVDAGIQTFQCRGLAYDLGLEGQTVKDFTALLGKLYRVFRQNDAELVEINPLFITKDGGLVAGDGKLSIDDNSLFRQSRFEITRDYFESDMEYEAHKDGIPYLQFDGDISLMCAGAGLTTTVYDLINYAGGKIANYLEFGGPNYKRAVRAMELCLQNKNAKVILIVTFGTIARADVMAEGIKQAIEELKPSIPIVTCIRGTNEEAATETLRAAGLDPMFDTEEAVEKAVKLAKEAG